MSMLPIDNTTQEVYTSQRGEEDRHRGTASSSDSQRADQPVPTIEAVGCRAGRDLSFRESQANIDDGDGGEAGGCAGIGTDRAEA